MASRVMDISFVAIILFLVLSNGDSFSKVLSAISSTYISGVRTLQGR